MGSIKRGKTEGEFKLTDEQFAFVELLNQMKNQYVQDMNHRISSVLNNLAKTQYGFQEQDDLQFELDFSDETHMLKVTKL
jgi:hypothetical protein